MAEFTGDLQSFEPSLPFLEMNSNMELINQFSELNPSVLEKSNWSTQSFFSNNNFLDQQQPEFLMSFTDNLLGLSYPGGINAAPVVQSTASAGDVFHESTNTKVMAILENSSVNSSPPVSETGLGGDNEIKRKNSLGRGKRGRRNVKEGEKPKEVIHLRARRGQATDSHSLAERVRREKINEKLRFLQDLVPGCYKAIGMVVMLDEIISYVRSLQNQIEFLSMKLTAASSIEDFPSYMESMETMQGTNAYEAREVERLLREGYGGSLASPQHGPFDSTFGSYSPLP